MQIIKNEKQKLRTNIFIGRKHFDLIKNRKFNLLIKDVRKHKHENQKTFAIKFGVSHTTVSNWEKGVFDIPNTVIDYCLEYLFNL